MVRDGECKTGNKRKVEEGWELKEKQNIAKQGYLKKQKERGRKEREGKKRKMKVNQSEVTLKEGKVRDIKGWQWKETLKCMNRKRESNWMERRINIEAKPEKYKNGTEKAKLC